MGQKVLTLKKVNPYDQVHLLTYDTRSFHLYVYKRSV